ncbi:hypothetical protein P3X46_001364 [Hevea brasiliensis]|uniref:Uncharacterized protein n=1 Tax=Hevea brasiliensis TaxID=3981 RepID=A0ABQ9NCU0_HEVBR|nr:hypothetical protein P3X46_001364 [Hevea brasiliensis]
MQHQNHKTIDLTGKCLLDEIPSREKLFVPYTAKKHKGFNLELELKSRIENTQEHSSSVKRDHGIAQEDSEFLAQKNKVFTLLWYLVVMRTTRKKEDLHF